MSDTVAQRKRTTSNQWSRWAPTGIVVLLALIFIVSTRSASTPEGWGHDYEAAMIEAVEKQHPVLIAFHSNNCPPCIAMDRYVLTTPIVIEAVKRFTPVVVDMYKRFDLAEKFKVDGTPTYAIIDQKEKLHGKIVGFHDADDFVRFLNNASKSFTPSIRQFEAVSTQLPDGD